MRALKLIAASLLAISSLAALAVEVPSAGKNDPRVRYVDYSADNVVLVNVRRGTVTRIVFAPDEKIETVASGYFNDCKSENAEWCIKADSGSNQIFIKPQLRATANNLEVKTDKRDYSLEFRVLSDAPNGRFGEKVSLAEEPISRVIFTYPSPKIEQLPSELLGEAQPKRDTKEELRTALAAKPKVRNAKYTYKVGEGAKDFVPSLVFDDGRFTYFKFPKNRQVPAIFLIDAKGVEYRVNFTMEADDLVAVQRLGRQFVLRQDDAVVGIWNEAFDGDGVAVSDSVTVDGVRREIKQ